jgi:hypothetical protein
LAFATRQPDDLHVDKWAHALLNCTLAHPAFRRCGRNGADTARALPPAFRKRAWGGQGAAAARPLRLRSRALPCPASPPTRPNCPLALCYSGLLFLGRGFPGRVSYPRSGYVL